MEQKCRQDCYEVKSKPAYSLADFIAHLYLLGDHLSGNAENPGRCEFYNKHRDLHYHFQGCIHKIHQDQPRLFADPGDATSKKDCKEYDCKHISLHKRLKDIRRYDLNKCSPEAFGSSRNIRDRHGKSKFGTYSGFNGGYKEETC